MSLILLIIVVLICLVLILYGLDQVPMQPPLNWLIRVLVILLAVLIILAKTGLLS